VDAPGPKPDALLEVLGDARRAGFLGPGPLEPQLQHGLGFAAIARRLSVPTAAAGGPLLADLGSGGGLPGLVVASALEEATVVLIDSSARRTAFLRRAVARLGLGERVRVVGNRAEVCGRDEALRGSFDGVMARSFGRPAVVAECAAPLLKTGGWLLVSEPPAGEGPDGHRWPAEPLRQLGLVAEEPIREPFEYQVLRQREPCPDRFPRRVGVPAKRPLF
jgi:16S rRNA (guanine527-N7)-methyltransferase